MVALVKVLGAEWEYCGVEWLKPFSLPFCTVLKFLLKLFFEDCKVIIIGN